MQVAVAGATGVVGRHVVEELGRRGHRVVPVARSLGVDVLHGDALVDTLADTEAVIDVLSTRESNEKKAAAFFETTSTNLLRAEQRVGVRHHVALSIVGVDDVPFGYYRAKVRQEAVVAGGPVPWTILRATQFHEFAGQLLDRFGSRLIALIPSMLSQPVAAVEVARALVERAEAGPSGRTPDLAGPEQRTMPPMARAISRATHRQQLVLPLHVPGAAGRAMRAGALLPADRRTARGGDVRRLAREDLRTTPLTDVAREPGPADSGCSHRGLGGWPHESVAELPDPDLGAHARLPVVAGGLREVRAGAEGRRLPLRQRVPRAELPDRGHRPQAGRARHRAAHNGKVATGGLLSGLWMGLFVGLVVSLFGTGRPSRSSSRRWCSARSSAWCGRWRATSRHVAAATSRR